MKNEINGVLLFNKPQGLSSNAALQKIKRIYSAKKAGHTGTLDPLATGLLPICFGEATKFAGYLLDADKEYIATIKLGETTTTYDSCGDIVSTHAVNCTDAEISAVVNSFLGRVWQTPPIYSALKVNGKPLYKYAREGVEVAIKSREIDIFGLEILEFIRPAIFKLRVLCSKGTYIRTLAHDIGNKLGCGAHLINLVRTKTSGFILDGNITLEYLSQLSDCERQELLLPVDILVSDLPRLDLDEIQFANIKNGHAFTTSHCDNAGQQQSKFNILKDDNKIRLYFADKFLGIAEIFVDTIKPIRLMRI